MRLSKHIQQALDDCGKPWSLRRGSRHLKIIVGDRFAGILPRSGAGSTANIRAEKNVVAQIKRAAKGLQP